MDQEPSGKPEQTPSQQRRKKNRERGLRSTASLLARFAREVDPDGTLDPAERARRVEEVRKAHYRRIGALGRAAQAARPPKAMPAAPGSGNGPNEPSLIEQLRSRGGRETLGPDPEVIASAALDTPEGRRVLAARDVGAAFRMLVAAGMTQTLIARATGQTPSEVSEILNGRRVVGYDVLVRTAEGLGVPRGWMGLAYTDANAPGDVTTYPAGGVANTEDAMRRRHVLDLLAIGSLAVLGAPVLSDSHTARLLRLGEDPPPERMGAGDVAAICAATEAFRQLDHQHGGLIVCEAVSRSARHLSTVLATQLHPETDLLVAVAHQHSLAGVTAADAGAPDLARHHFWEALALAGQAQDQDLIAWVLDDIGRMELFCCAAPNDGLAALQLAVARIPAWPLWHALVATCYAQLGQEAETRRHLAQAAVSEPPRGLDGQTGHALLALGDLQGAVAYYERSLSARGEDPADARARCMEYASLATAHLRAGNLAAGTAAAQRCLQLVSGLRSISARASLQPLQRAAAQRRDSTCQDLARRVRQAVAAA